MIVVVVVAVVVVVVVGIAIPAGSLALPVRIITGIYAVDLWPYGKIAQRAIAILQD
jgi:hypothetical protein